MAGAVREALARLRQRIAMVAVGEGAEQLPDDLLAVVGLLSQELRLRNALADPGAEPERRAALARRVLAGRIGGAALSAVEEVVTARWARARDLVDEIEVLAAKASFARAEAAGTLDRVEDDLFRFGRTLAAEPRLRLLLDDPAVPVETKRSVLHDLLDGRADPVAVALVDHVVAVPRGRRVVEAIDELVALAAERREELLAEVTSAVPLTAEEENRLTAVLGRVYGRTVRVHVDVDPAVLGGLRVVVGEEVIDGTVLHRLEQARRQVAG